VTGGDKPLVTHSPDSSTTTAAIPQLGTDFFAHVLEGLLDGTETVNLQNAQLMMLCDRLNGE
jgi:hypothetical protein